MLRPSRKAAKSQSAPDSASSGLRLPRALQGKGGVAYKRASHQEKESAGRLARTIAGSGRLMEKGDVRAPTFARVECKNTASLSFRVTAEMVDKITEASLPHGELPYIEVDLGVGLGPKQGPTHRLAVVPLSVLHEILTHYTHVKASSK